MKMEKNMEELKVQLLSLGFENGLEQELLFEICFLPEQFIIRKKINFQPDILLFALYFERSEAGAAYYCRYYDATLRKQNYFDGAGRHSEMCLNLDRRIGRIEWDLIDRSKDFSLSLASEIESIVEELNLLSVDEKGKELANQLRFKHWSNTSMEHRISVTPQLRNKFEITQRFYLFEGEAQITVREAYRFLHNRWLEKQMTYKKKTGEPPAGNEESVESTGSGGKEKSRKLLPKKTRGRHSRERNV